MIRTTDPTGPGALAGFETTCPLCGMVLRNSLRSSLELDAESHAEWHRKNERARNPFETLRENPFETPVYDARGRDQFECDDPTCGHAAMEEEAR